MVAAMKFFFAIVALVCCMEFVEMARMRRDEPAIPADNDIAKTLETMFGTLKTQLEENPAFKEIAEKIKDFKPEDAAALVNKVTTNIKENFGNAENFVKEAIEKINKEAIPAKTD